MVAFQRLRVLPMVAGVAAAVVPRQAEQAAVELEQVQLQRLLLVQQTQVAAVVEHTPRLRPLASEEVELLLLDALPA
jgi:hypothetical protein